MNRLKNIADFPTLKTQSHWGYKIEVKGYIRTRDGIFAVGIYRPTEENPDDNGRASCDAVGFNRSTPKDVWALIPKTLSPENIEAICSAASQCPPGVVEAVNQSHRDWRRSIGKSPDLGICQRLDGSPLAI